MAIAVWAAAVGAVVPAEAAAADRDCADFPTQAAAQRYYVEKGGPRSDPDRLDSDDDGVACEELPCPCSTGGGNPQPNRPSRPRRPARPSPVDFRARIIAVVDGDTVRLRSTTTGRAYTVRLIGVDTPETKKPRTPIECGGPQAASNLRGLAPHGRYVRVRGDATQDRVDRYGRLLAYLTAPSGRDLGNAQINAGWSPAYVYERRFKRYGSYKRAERLARRASRGGWWLCGGDFHTRSRERLGPTRDGYTRCDGGTNPDGSPGRFFRDIEVRGASCAEARSLVREWAIAVSENGAPDLEAMQVPISVTGWTCSGELRQGPDNPYFLGSCDRADGAALLRFFGGP